MTHSYHEALDGFDRRQIWHDGCEECEARGRRPQSHIGTLDSERFVRAWQRASDWNRGEDIGDVSDAEAPLLNLFWCFQVAFERECGLPIGELPVPGFSYPERVAS